MVEAKKDAAKKIAEAHSRIDEDVKAIYLLESDDEDEPGEPIKLLEVVAGTPELGIEPIGFGPNAKRGVHYRSVIVELSPREFESVHESILVDDKEWRIVERLPTHVVVLG